MAAMAIWSLFVLTTLAVHISAEGTFNYNSETHICCNGTVFTKGANSGCCGSVEFDFTKSGCCANQVFPIPEGGASFQLGCCYSTSQPDAAKPFDTRTHDCCDGEILDKPVKDGFFGCCAGKLFNYTSQLCCGKEVHEMKAGEQCCGDKVFNFTKQICCEKWHQVDGLWSAEHFDIHDRKGKQSFCCGREVYDLADEVCCNDKIMPKPAHIAPGNAGCCDDEVIDHESQVCCQVFKNVSGIFESAVSKVHANVGNTTTCCGVNVFDYRKEVCCNETLLPKPEGMGTEAWGTCCGDQVMTSFEFQLCDNGKLIERNSTDIWTCGEQGKLFNLTRQTCCYGEILDNDSDTDCCYLASKTFNKKTESCCATEVIPLTEEDIAGGKNACCSTFPSFPFAQRPASSAANSSSG